MKRANEIYVLNNSKNNAVVPDVELKTTLLVTSKNIKFLSRNF